MSQNFKRYCKDYKNIENYDRAEKECPDGFTPGRLLK